MMEIDRAFAAAESSEGVDVAIPQPAPILKLNAEFESCARGGHEFRFVDTEPLIEAPDVGERRFTDADDSDRFRFDKVHGAAAREQLHQGCSSHPTGGPAAHNDNVNPRFVGHCLGRSHECARAQLFSTRSTCSSGGHQGPPKSAASWSQCARCCNKLLGTVLPSKKA